MAKKSKDTPVPVPQALIRFQLETLRPLMESAWRERKFPQALLLTGIPGCGKREMGRYLAQWLLCQKNVWNAENTENEPSLLWAAESPVAAPPSFSDHPCESCISCRRAQQSQWIDFVEIAPEVDPETGDTGRLRLEQFKDLKEKQGYSAHEGFFKVFLISRADTMTPQAANSLLKILEEPPQGWVFILTAQDPSLVLPTLVSRSQRARLRPLSQATLEEVLRTQYDADARTADAAANAACGSLEQALRRLQGGVTELEDRLGKFLRNPSAELPAFVDWVAASDARFEDLLGGLERKLVKTSAKNLMRNGAETLARARLRQHAPLNRKLVIQETLAPWLTPQ